jgi:hypothetical protein
MSVRPGFSRLSDRLKPVLTLAILLILACSHAPPPSPPPASVPSAVVEMMCGRIRSEGMTADLRVVKTTQPLVSQGLINALADVAFYHGKPVAPVAPVSALPVEPGSCTKVMIDSMNPRRDADVMVLQFSSPFSNPFSRRQLGVVARISLGDDAPTWYWIPIGEKDGSWRAGSPMILSVRD